MSEGVSIRGGRVTTQTAEVHGSANTDKALQWNAPRSTGFDGDGIDQHSVDVAALGKIDAENSVHPQQTSLHLHLTGAIAKCRTFSFRSGFLSSP